MAVAAWCLVLAGMVALLSGCGGPRLVIVNESAGWLRFEAASEVDQRRASMVGPLAGDAARTFGVPPGARFEQELEAGGSIFTQRRLGVVMRMRVGAAPGRSVGPLRSPELSTTFAIRLPPPGPYALLVTGEPGAIEIVRIDADGQPMDAETLRVVPESAGLWWGLGEPP